MGWTGWSSLGRGHLSEDLKELRKCTREISGDCVLSRGKLSWKRLFEEQHGVLLWLKRVSQKAVKVRPDRQWEPGSRGLWTILRTLAFTLSEVESHCRVYIRRVT